MSGSKRTAHYVASTHWDREWYESFQDYRFRLVRLLDEVLETMRRDATFRYFQTDGQSIILEDYLEVRPEQEPVVRELAEAGRLRIGPWYVLPDEFLVSGESLIRNLQVGISTAAGFGRPARVGFLCDMFGHISQLPQILRGFGIDNALLWRGVNEQTHGAMFRWQSPDGSEVNVYRFSPESGYSSYAFKVRKAHRRDEEFDLETATGCLREMIVFEADRCPTDALLIFDGGDHLEIEPQTPELIERVNRQLEDVEIVHSHLEGFVEEMREQRDRLTRTFVGELREPGAAGDDQWLIPGVASSRIHLKQANTRCETELCQWAEPFSTFAAARGREYPHRYLELAWRYLLQNHPHDSICGCSIDAVHRDMAYRFDQCLGIAAHLTADALRYIADQVQLPELGEQDLALVVFNPSADAIDGPVDLTLRFPSHVDAVFQEWFGYEPKIGFRLHDAGGAELPYQLVNHRRDQYGYQRPLRKFPLDESRHEVDVTVTLQVPAFGYTTVVCRPIKEPTRYLGSMLVDDHTIENEHLRVSVNPNGTLKLTDKRNGEVYDQLLTLEDCADIGDGWFHGTAVNEQVFTSTASSAAVAVTADGIGKATLAVRVTVPVPEAFVGHRKVRSEVLTPLEVTHHVTLGQGGDEVEVRTVVENTARDHRLRVLMPTGADATTYLADQAFDVVERPIALREDRERQKEIEVETKPQQTWTAVHDEQRGLAVVSTGLPESAVRDLPDRPIALTLLRAFIRAVMTSGNEGGQIQGRHTFRYRIIPLLGAPEVARLCRRGQRLAADVRVVQLSAEDAARARASRRPADELPLVQSFLELDAAEPVITALHHRDAGQGPSLRLFNPTAQAVNVGLKLADASEQAELTDLEGHPLGEADHDGDRVNLTLEPKRIATVRWNE